jgi:CO/xanthine dehydrogenase FAD-binding subunit
MLSPEINWYFPATAKEAVNLIRKNGIILHGGGTKILEPQPRSSIKGLVDTAGLGLKYIKVKGSTIHIGSGATFADVAEYSRNNNRMAALGSSLSQGASTPLRNRITIGGSIKDFPIWSSLYAPLLALDAQIAIAGERSGVYPLEMYASSSLIKSKHLVLELRVAEKRDVVCKSTTFHVLRFEYPLFCLSAALTLKRNVVRGTRIFITGVKKRYARLKTTEDYLAGKTLTEDTAAEASRRASFAFVPDYKFSAEYKERAAKVYLNDLLQDIRRENQ